MVPMTGKNLGALDRVGKQYHLQMAAHLFAGGDPAGAFREFDAALAIDPEDGAISAEKARVLGAVGRWDQAVETLRLAVERDAENAELHRSLGFAYESCGRYGEAAEAYGNAVRLAGEPSAASADLARVRAAAHRPPGPGPGSSFEDVSAGEPFPGTLPGERVIIREIVRIPCQYCGSLVDITRTTCQSCGAPLR